jgi:hypothetical protein
MYKVLALDAWRSRLKSRGHQIIAPEWVSATSLILDVPADMVITVAVQADISVGPAYRNRYFVCEPEPEHVFRQIECPQPHRGRWLELISQQPDSYWRDFMAGPGSWTLARLVRFDQVVIWPEDRGADWGGIDAPAHRHWGMQIPSKAAPYFPPADSPESDVPRVINAESAQFADVVAACFLLSNVGLRDCYLADASGHEVYLINNDEFVFVSIPDLTRRTELLQDLDRAQWPIKNVSGFLGSMEEEPP